jgi:hypothetical protein
VGVAGLAALVLVATCFEGAAEEERRGGGGPVDLQAVGAVGPGSLLTLNTAAGPMQLTVDSQMNEGAPPRKHACVYASVPRLWGGVSSDMACVCVDAAGYVHAYGYENGQMYAGYVKLSAQNAAAQQALAQAPSDAQAQLAQYPPANPYSRQLAYTAAQEQWGGPQQTTLAEQAPSMQQAQPGAALQLHVGVNGGVTLDGQRVVPSDSKTSAILRLLAKRAEAQRAGLAGGAAVQSLSSGWQTNAHSKLDSEIARAKRLVSKLEAVRSERGDARSSMLVAKRSVRRRHERHGHEPRAAIWAAMQSLMHSVDRIQAKQSQMEKVVHKVNAC